MSRRLSKDELLQSSASVDRLQWLLYLRPRATIDFETRSACSLTDYGAWIYSKDPTTQVMCLAYKLPGWDEPKLWHMAHGNPDDLFDGIPESDPPAELFEFIEAGGLVEAHNVFFERCIWENVCVERMGWPEVDRRQWRCTAARASAAALPRKLEMAVPAAGLDWQHDKDKAGHSLMLKMARPRKPRKAEIEEWIAAHGDEPMPLQWHEDPEDLVRLWRYCRQDVRAEEALGAKIPELPEKELLLWQLDQEINWRGLQVDLALARIALEMARAWRDKLNSELYGITAGTVERGSQRQRVKDWLKEYEDLNLPDTTKDTLEHLLASTNPDRLSRRALRVLEILKQVNKTSVKKWQSMLDYADPDDGRIRDLLMFCGAGTGRWTGKGLQVHNFPRGLCKNAWYVTVDGIEIGRFDMDQACQTIMTGDVSWVHAMNGDVMECLSSALRGGIVPREGKDLMVADYAAIEARVVLWLAGAEKALDVFRRGEDIYCDMATGIYGYPVNKDDHPLERQFGKQAILGLGFGMGFLTFFVTCRGYGITFPREQVVGIMGDDRLLKYETRIRDVLSPEKNHDRWSRMDTKSRRAARLESRRVRTRLLDIREDPDAVVHELALMKYTVDVYRSRYPEVKEMWYAQEAAAVKAAMTGETVREGRCEWFRDGSTLRCRLPSGRCLSYPDAYVKMAKTSWGEDKPALRYMTLVGGHKWAETFTYGGKVVENETQATARDIMADAMLAASPRALAYFRYETDILEEDMYSICLSVHDELAAEVDKNEGSREEFEGIMSAVDPWASTCPIAAVASRMDRYRKG